MAHTLRRTWHESAIVLNTHKIVFRWRYAELFVTWYLRNNRHFPWNMVGLIVLYVKPSLQAANKSDCRRITGVSSTIVHKRLTRQKRPLSGLVCCSSNHLSTVWRGLYYLRYLISPVYRASSVLVPNISVKAARFSLDLSGRFEMCQAADPPVKWRGHFNWVCDKLAAICKRHY